MKKIIICLLAASFTGCATNAAMKSAPQYYRPAGSADRINIEAALITKNEILENSAAVLFRVDNETRLGFNLDRDGNGHFYCDDKTDTGNTTTLLCKPIEHHRIAATCYGSTVNKRISRVNCTFTYDNETAANFTF